MGIEKLFPFESVPKGSRIIIYGYGKWGRSYVGQINKSSWCDIVGVVDRKYDCLDEVELLDISACKENDKYDYIVIAISNYFVAQDIERTLIEMGVDRNKIVYRSRNEINLSKQHQIENSYSDELTVQLIVNGGVGDAIMVTAFYSRLLQIVPDVVIDVYINTSYAFVYRNKSNVRRILPINEKAYSSMYYDLSVYVDWNVLINFCRYEEIAKKSDRLSKLIKSTELIYEGYMDRHITNVTLYRIKEAQINNKDRFWLMGCGDVWGISSDMMELELYPEFSEVFDNLKLGRYITINCGADAAWGEDNDDVITKTWPIKYFEKFILKFKECYHDINVVQLGSANNRKIKGADFYLLGEPFELVEYIIKNSLLHIDDEGGLVHMATVLGTKCVVLFGPTPMDIFEYKQNINICSQTCNECYGFAPDWGTYCINRKNRKKCMYDIKPERVLQCVGECLDSKIYEAGNYE